MKGRVCFFVAIFALAAQSGGFEKLLISGLVFSQKIHSVYIP